MKGKGASDSQFDPLTSQVIGCAFDVANTLGHGFLEKVYENALAIELRKSGLHVEQQRAIQVTYGGEPVGDFVADMVVQETLIVELKAVKAIENIHLAQCLNYLKATGLRTCLLLNFGTPRIGVKRISL